MTTAGVNDLGAVELGVPDLDAAVRFYEDTWGLQSVAREATACYLRASGPQPYVLALHRRDVPQFVRLRLSADGRAAVDQVFARVKGAGGMPLGPPDDLTTPGAGYGFAFRDPEGREVVVVADARLHADSAHLDDRPFRLSHVVFNSTALDDAAKFFADALGFKVRDRTRKASFMGCNADHHCIAFTNRGNTALSHVAFELPSLDAVLRGCGRLKKAGMTLEWGIGRHGTGNNVFAYFVDLNNFAIEYTTEMEQVDDATYVPGTPETIGRPSHSDVWGFAEPPTERFLRALEGHTQRQTKVA